MVDRQGADARREVRSGQIDRPAGPAAGALDQAAAVSPGPVLDRGAPA
jgi:hypothetical protein